MAFRRRALLFFASCIGLLLPLVAFAAPMSPSDYYYVSYSGRDGVGTIQGLHDSIGLKFYSNFIDTHGNVTAIDSPQPNFVYTYSDWKNTAGTKLGTRQDIKNPDGNFLITNYIDLQGRVHVGDPNAPAVVPQPQPASAQSQASQGAGQSPTAGSLGSSLNGSSNTTSGTSQIQSNTATTRSMSSISKGLIPCAGAVTAADGTPACQACDVVSLIQNIINFAIGLSIPIFMGLFAWAGVLYFTSATDPHNIEHAKKIFSTAIIGFVVALGAYLIVNTILHTILDPGQFSEGSWFKIKCVDDSERRTNGTISDLLKEVLGNDNSPIVVGSTSIVPTCATGSYIDEKGKQGCYSSSGTYLGQATAQTVIQGGTKVTDPQLAAEIYAACATYKNCALAQGISKAESSGGANCTTSPTGAVGCMQILATTACSINSLINGCGACLSSRNSTSAACQPVAAAISIPMINTQLGVKYLSQLSSAVGGSCELTAAAYYQGLGNVQKYGGVPPKAVSYVAKVCG